MSDFDRLTAERRAAEAMREQAAKVVQSVREIGGSLNGEPWMPVAMGRIASAIRALPIPALPEPFGEDGVMTLSEVLLVERAVSAVLVDCDLAQHEERLVSACDILRATIRTALPLPSTSPEPFKNDDAGSEPLTPAAIGAGTVTPEPAASEITGFAMVAAEPVSADEARVDAGEGRHWRPEIIAFADLMEQQLRANDHKPGWKRDDPLSLLNRVADETEELSRAVRRHIRIENDLEPSRGSDPCWRTGVSHLIGKEAADVANLAMMIADLCGAFILAPEPNSANASEPPIRAENAQVLPSSPDAGGPVEALTDKQLREILAHEFESQGVTGYARHLLSGRCDWAWVSPVLTAMRLCHARAALAQQEACRGK